MNTFYGCDVSEWNGPTGGHAPIDWAALNPGAAFAWIKGSGGDGDKEPLYVDAQLGHNKAGVRALGNAMPHGFYHFAGGHDASQEAHYFFDNVCSDLQVGEAIALDWEIEHPDPNGWIESFKTVLEGLVGFHITLYVDTERVNRFGFKNILTTSPLWIADYRFTPDQNIPGVPVYTFHQYKSNGTFPGIQGEVDTDAFFAPDITDFFKLGKPAAIVTKPVQAPEIPVPVITNTTPTTVIEPTVQPKPTTGTAIDVVVKPKQSSTDKVISEVNTVNEKVAADLPEIIQTASDAMNIKTGYKTTEFWMTLLTDITTLAGSLFAPGSLALKLTLAVTGVATTVVYIFGRVSLKKHALGMSATVAAASQAPKN